MTLGDLSGCCVLVLEDEFLLAEEIKDALELAGADVLGPCADTSAALRLMDRTRPDLAVVDVNLRNGPTFEASKALTNRSIPFAFVTGYDASIVPPEFAGAPRFEKPVDPRELVAALVQLNRTS